MLLGHLYATRSWFRNYENCSSNFNFFVTYNYEIKCVFFCLSLLSHLLHWSQQQIQIVIPFKSFPIKRYSKSTGWSLSFRNTNSCWNYFYTWHKDFFMHLVLRSNENVQRVNLLIIIFCPASFKIAWEVLSSYVLACPRALGMSQLGDVIL